MKRIQSNRRYVVFTDNKGNDIFPANDENSVFVGENNTTLKDKLAELDTQIDLSIDEIGRVENEYKLANTSLDEKITTLESDKADKVKVVEDIAIAKKELQTAIDNIKVADSHTHTNKDVLDKISQDTNGLPLYNGISLKGQKGDVGIDGDSLEIRKTGSEIQYRCMKNSNVTLDYSTSRIVTNISANDRISRILLSEVPDNITNAQVKTVSVFGTNDDGTVGLNINPSILTMPAGTSFDCFGGLDPSLGAFDITTNKELVANAKIEDIINYALEDMKKQDNRITKITKIFFHIYFLDKSLKDVKRVEARYMITDTPSSDGGWETLITLSEITTPQSRLSDTHDNKVVLDALSDDNGLLKYNGKAIGVTLEKFNELEARVSALEPK